MSLTKHPWLARFGMMMLALATVYAYSQPDAEARPKRLSAVEAETLLAGNTVIGFNPSDDSTYVMFHSGNGRVRAELRSVNGELSKSGGRWWISDEGLLCVDWDNFRWINSCALVVQDDETLTFQDPSGRIVSFGEIAKGNPDDL